MLIFLFGVFVGLTLQYYSMKLGIWLELKEKNSKLNTAIDDCGLNKAIEVATEVYNEYIEKSFNIEDIDIKESNVDMATGATIVRDRIQKLKDK
jgi:hypothetical protein